MQALKARMGVWSWLRVPALLPVLLMPGAAAAQVASDKAAAVVVYPVIQVASVDHIDTVVQLSNTSDQPVTVRCFYINADGHCSDSGNICFTGADCGGSGSCLPGWNETDFRVQLTARQPLIWRAKTGLSGSSLPLDGTKRRGVNGQSNAGTRVPSVSADPFVGELLCVAVDNDDHPSSGNVLVGAAITEQVFAGFMDVTRYSAVGIRAAASANNGDNTLRLGEEYSACPQTLVMNHFFDGASNPVNNETVKGALTVVPCSVDLLAQQAAAVTLQFLVFNEFEQRFSTSTPVNCFGNLPLSNIDTTQADRSIFHVGVEGTLTGQTRIRGVAANGHGLLGTYFDLHGSHSTAANLYFQGVSDQVDIIRLP